MPSCTEVVSCGHGRITNYQNLIFDPDFTSAHSYLIMNLVESENEGYLYGKARIYSSIQFSESEGRQRIPTRDRFLSSVTNLRNISNQSIRDIPENDRNNSAVVAGYNVTNLIQGIGILGVPYALSKGSWIGAAIIWVTAAIACYTGKMLIDCLYDNTASNGRKRVRKSYSSIGEAVWPRVGRPILNVITFIEMFGALTLYVILMSVESQKLISIFDPDFSIYYCSIILTLLALPFSFITRMSFVSWFSFIAVLALFGTIASIMLYCFLSTSMMSISHFPPISPETVPLSIGIITFSYCAHAAFPGIESCMKNPSAFDRVMNVSFLLAAVIKFTMAFLFVVIKGSATFQQCSLNIDIPAISITLEVFIILNTFFSIPLTIFIITELVDDVFQSYFHHSLWPGGRFYWFWLLLTRSLIMLASMFTAMMIPYFALMMALVGSITGSCLTFIFPCIFSLILKKYELLLWEKMIRIVLIFLGVVFAISGTYVSIKEIRNTFL